MEGTLYAQPFTKGCRFAQVRQLQQAVLNRQRFGGYSGPARAVSGPLRCWLPPIMASDRYPQTHRAFFPGGAQSLFSALVLKWRGFAVLVFE
jgi:hypothetical protein